MTICSQCGLPLRLIAVNSNPNISSESNMVAACQNCGARNYEEPVKSAGINMILAGRVAELEKENESLKACCDDYVVLMKRSNTMYDNTAKICDGLLTKRKELEKENDIMKQALFQIAMQGNIHGITYEKLYQEVLSTARKAVEDMKA